MIDIKNLTVARLRYELKRRGLPTDGLKATLIQRFTAVIEEESAASLASDMPDSCRDTISPARCSPTRATSAAALSSDWSKNRGAKPENPKTLLKAGKVTRLRREHNDIEHDRRELACAENLPSNDADEHVERADGEFRVMKREQQNLKNWDVRREIVLKPRASK